MDPLPPAPPTATPLPMAPNRPRGEFSPLLDLRDVGGLEAGGRECLAGDVRPLPADTEPRAGTLGG